MRSIIGGKDRSAALGGWIALGLSLALVARVVAIDNVEALLIIAPALLGSIVAVLWPRTRSTLVLAIALIAMTAVLSLIGGVGLLYIPSMFLVGRALVSPRSNIAARAS